MPQNVPSVTMELLISKNQFPPLYRNILYGWHYLNESRTWYKVIEPVDKVLTGRIVGLQTHVKIDVQSYRAISLNIRCRKKCNTLKNCVHWHQGIICSYSGVVLLGRAQTNLAKLLLAKALLLDHA